MTHDPLQAAYSITHRCPPAGAPEPTHGSGQDPSSNPNPNPDQGTPPRVSCLFPPTRGVVEMLGEDGSSIMLAATGNIRDFIAQRMNEDGALSPRANLAPVTARIVAYPTGSALESDLLVLGRAGGADADLHARIVEQNRRALLVLDPDSGTHRVADTAALTLKPRERVVGPILSAKGAAALGETLDEVFELCRYPKELAKAPGGTACAYKQMGRCPAACDGSEPMSAYHERFGRALEAAEMGVQAWGGSVRARIVGASAELDFERAQRLKRDLDRIDRLPIDALVHAGSLHDFACVCVTPAWRRGWAMVWVLGGAGLVPIVAIEGDAPAGLGALIASHATPMAVGRATLECFSLVARHWFTKPARARRRRVTILDLRDDRWFEGLPGAIADAQSPSDPGHDDEEHTHIRGE